MQSGSKRERGISLGSQATLLEIGSLPGEARSGAGRCSHLLRSEPGRLGEPWPTPLRAQGPPVLLPSLNKQTEKGHLGEVRGGREKGLLQCTSFAPWVSLSVGLAPGVRAKGSLFAKGVRGTSLCSAGRASLGWEEDKTPAAGLGEGRRS